ncbi:autotransporter outer membrane beta-barrel domain-containing protein [Candidatus Bartonella washoeensis]|uniref:Uncharacterized protein n=1 Tax=Cardidatus Bartonella washoeensis 085-0475 TaxID=1094564 RepID=J0QI65_9HYPH|nr:autotransporter outer membrane beta-barrel domain-containing protein [Bartonella washoeensis]EJF82574.1 hypothetical protein MCW_01641 [Bartonella washoeensis 085-0475]
MLKNTGTFWDFRLESKEVVPPVSLPPFLAPVIPVMTQSHPVLPTFGSSVTPPVFELFSHRLLKINENPVLFLRGCGGYHRYTSNFSALEYGYRGDLDHNALEAGILLKKIESAYSTTSFGIMGNYGKLSLLPREIKQNQESIFDKWTITAYGSMQHDMVFYMDGLFSYGF